MFEEGAARVRKSWEEIDEDIDHLRDILRAKHLPPQSRIVLIGRNSIRYFTALIAIRRAGHIAVPLSRSAPPAYFEGLFEELSPSLVFCEGKRPGAVPFLDLSQNFGALKVERGAALDPLPADPNRLALIVYTSGSSGRPKGVAISERARRAFMIASTMFEANNADCTLISTPLSHVLALHFMESAFARRESVVLMPQFDGSEFLRAIEAHSVTKISMVPSMWAMILRDEESLRRIDLSSVRHVFFSSEPLHPHLVAAAERYFPGAEIENCYGLSEAGPNLFGPHPGGRVRPSLSVGFPRRGIEYRLVAGQLEIRTPFMMKEYYRHPELTGRSVTEDGFYKTRDRFSVDENGFYFFLGRDDDLILSGGENIFPAEVGSALDRHPEMFRCAVLGLPDKIKGQKVYAFVVRKPGSSVTESALKEFLMRHIPAYAVPKNIWFLDDLPATANLKIDYQRLREIADELLGN